MRPQQQQQIKNNNHNQINMHNVDPISAQNILRAHGVELKQLLNLVQHIPSSQQNQQRKANPNTNNNIIVNGNPNINQIQMRLPMQNASVNQKNQQLQHPTMSMQQPINNKQKKNENNNVVNVNEIGGILNMLTSGIPPPTNQNVNCMNKQRMQSMANNQRRASNVAILNVPALPNMNSQQQNQQMKEQKVMVKKRMSSPPVLGAANHQRNNNSNQQSPPQKKRKLMNVANGGGNSNNNMSNMQMNNQNNNLPPITDSNINLSNFVNNPMLLQMLMSQVNNQNAN